MADLLIIYPKNHNYGSRDLVTKLTPVPASLPFPFHSVFTWVMCLVGWKSPSISHHSMVTISCDLSDKI